MGACLGSKQFLNFKNYCNMTRVFVFTAVLFSLYACKKTDSPSESLLNAYYYEETQCADVWMNFSVTNRQEAIKNYLSDSLSISFSDFKYVEEFPGPDCLACICPTGFVIRLKAADSEDQALLAAGFKKD
jgi:hypothetical protein